MFYKLCYEPWSRTCIKGFDYKVTNIDFLKSIQHLSIVFNITCNRNRPPNLLNHKSPPQRMKCPLGAILPKLKTTVLHKNGHMVFFRCDVEGQRMKNMYRLKLRHTCSENDLGLTGLTSAGFATQPLGDMTDGKEVIGGRMYPGLRS